MSIINKLNANLLIDFVQKSCTLSWLLPYAGGSYFFALPKKVTKKVQFKKRQLNGAALLHLSDTKSLKNEGTDLNLNQLGVLLFIPDLPIPYGFLRFSHCHARPFRIAQSCIFLLPFLYNFLVFVLVWQQTHFCCFIHYCLFFERYSPLNY